MKPKALCDVNVEAGPTSRGARKLVKEWEWGWWLRSVYRPDGVVKNSGCPERHVVTGLSR